MHFYLFQFVGDEDAAALVINAITQTKEASIIWVASLTPLGLGNVVDFEAVAEDSAHEVVAAAADSTEMVNTRVSRPNREIVRVRVRVEVMPIKVARI